MHKSIPLSLITLILFLATGGNAYSAGNEIPPLIETTDTPRPTVNYPTQIDGTGGLIDEAECGRLFHECCARHNNSCFQVAGGFLVPTETSVLCVKEACRFTIPASSTNPAKP